MIQEFYKTTIVSKYIKYLLSRVAIPINRLIFDNDNMYAGCLYAHKDNILLCTKSGRFVGDRGTLGVVDYLRVRNELEVSNTAKMKVCIPTDQGNYTEHEQDLTVTDNVVEAQLHYPAEFKVVNTFTPGVFKPGVTERFVSNCNYYDPQTHKALGRYLRYICNYYGLNLMHLYNCFCGEVLNTMQFSKDTNDVVTTQTDKTKILLIPIRYDETYTIAIDCDLPYMMKAILYNDGIIQDNRSQSPLHSLLMEDITVVNNSKFSNPITYSISLEGKENIETLHAYEKYLYLAIQIPADNESSVVVLEGDYTSNGNSSVVDYAGLNKCTLRDIGRILVSKLSLLSTNDGKNRPFADKLVQFLLGNTIDNREYIDDNVSNIEKRIGYIPEYSGQWDSTLQYILFSKYMSLSNREDVSMYDITGHVDSDVEKAVRKGYIVNDR